MSTCNPVEVWKPLGSGSNPSCETSSLHDRNLPGGQLPTVLWRWPVGLLSLNIKIKIKKKSLGSLN